MKSRSTRRRLHGRVTKSVRAYVRWMHIESLESRQLLAAEILELTSADLTELLGNTAEYRSEQLSDSLKKLQKDLEQNVDSSGGVNVPGSTSSPTGSLAIDQLANTTPNGVPLQLTEDGEIWIEAIVKNSHDVDTLQDELLKLGFEPHATFGKVTSGTLPMTAIGGLDTIESLQFARPVMAPITSVGSVTSQGDQSIGSDIVRDQLGYDGEGIKVGVLSDSFNRLNGAAAGIASGDLPGAANPNGFTTPVEVLSELALFSLAPPTDEGRAMLEIVHDVAPAADLSFASAFNGGTAGFASAITSLADAGSDVIVDDVIIFAEPWFQDGLVSQAVDSVVERGVSYFSAAGNQANNSFEANFNLAATSDVEGTSYRFHDFDPSSEERLFQFVRIPAMSTALFVLQWDDPFASSGGAGARSDVDLFLANFATEFSSTQLNVGNDAFEVVGIRNGTNQEQQFLMGVGVNTDTSLDLPNQFKYISFGGPVTGGDPDTDTGLFNGTSTVVGHNNSRLGASVAASNFNNTPAFGQEPPLPAPYTSLGGTEILFDTGGIRLQQPEVRSQPRFTGPDGANTSFFAQDSSNDADAFPNFFGTSAAAPHVAGAAALILQAAGGPGSLPPEAIYRSFERTAIDMSDPGADLLTGAGLVDLPAALAEAVRRELYFTASTPGGQRELYSTNGTSDATRLVRNLAGSQSGAPSNIFFDTGEDLLVDKGVIFNANLGNNARELFYSDGTSLGTQIIRNLSNSTSSNPSDFTKAGNKIFFVATLPNGNRELFRTRGTAASTVLVKDLGGTRSGDPKLLTELNGLLLFTAIGDDGQRELFVSDGTRGGTQRLIDLGGDSSSIPLSLVKAGGLVFFGARADDGQRELHVTDGTAAGTRLVRDISGGVSSDPRSLTAVGSRVYFTVNLPNGTRGLAISRGTAASTRVLGTISPSDLTAVGDLLYFVADLSETDDQRELFVSDGSVSGTRLTRNVSGRVSSEPMNLTTVGQRLAFTARLPSGERELFVADSAGVRLVANLSDDLSSTPSRLTAVGESVAFTAKINSEERELFFSDLSRSGTGLVRNLAGTNSSNPTALAAGDFAIVRELESEAANSGTTTNATLDLLSSNPQDINGDGQVTSLDALMVINQLSLFSSTGENRPESIGDSITSALTDPLLAHAENVEAKVGDVNRDGRVTALDALQIINRLSVSDSSQFLLPATASLTVGSDDDQKEAVDDELLTLLAESNLV